MGDHRGQRRAPRRGPSAPADTAAVPATPYAGRRVAGRTALPPTDAAPSTVAATLDAATPSPVVVGGRRRAPRGSRGTHPAVRALRPRPVLVGVAALAVAFGGAASSATPEQVRLTAAGGETTRGVHAPSALGGSTGSGSVDVLGRGAATVSRDSSRQALAAASGRKLVAAAERQAEERNAALAEFAAQAEQQAEKLALNEWSLPLAGYRLTAEFGDYGLWATYHTGLDFAADTGTPILSVANGTVTSTGYDGAYGNKTVVTHDDGTEVWYCHQTTIDVNVGDTVSSGQSIGTVGSTGNVTGPHLHLEVRPGGGDPVDPYSALQVHGLTP